MEDRSPFQLKNPELRELALLCGLAAVGIVITVGMVWVGWEIGGMLP